MAYAGYLFRVQNNLNHFRVSYCDGHLHNALLKLMHTLGIPVEMVTVDDAAVQATVV